MTDPAAFPVEAKAFFPRLQRFLRKPWSDKLQSLTMRWVKVAPVPVRLPFKVWWLAENDWCGTAILRGGLENAERAFVERTLQPGMTVLDIGAHHGFYSLLASRKVGATGRVFSFEPSPRERQRLTRHLRLNGCANVCVEPSALGSAEGETELFVVDGHETGCNSLRPPNTPGATRRIRVPVIRLDDFIEQQGIKRLDFIKIDVEGAELDVFRGAIQLLQCRPRPVILAEVYDIRTEPWGYKARDIIRFLHGYGYAWFLPAQNGTLKPVNPDVERFDGNFAAIPEERTQEVSRFLSTVRGN